MAGSTGPQQRKFHKKRDNKSKRKQKEQSSKGQYSFKGRVIKETCEVRDRHNSQSKIHGRKRGMARLKHTQRKRSPLGKEFLKSLRRLTRMEQATKDAEGTFHTLVASKGKEAITWWEEELKDECKGKEWGDMALETDWVTDPGATRPRETLYHKTVEMAWLTKMLIGKVKLEREEVRKEDNRETKTMLDEIQRRLNGLETIIKLLVEVEKDQKCKLERLAAQFHLYLRYVHHMDITLVDGQGAPTQIRKTCTVSPKEDSKGQADGGKEHPQVL
jgi:hypothetical protein